MNQDIRQTGKGHVFKWNFPLSLLFVLIETHDIESNLSKELIVAKAFNSFDILW
jgi:hypothetical protein